MGRRGKRLPTAVQVEVYRIGLTRQELAKLYGTKSITFIQDVLVGNRPPPERLQALLEHLTGKSRAELFPHLEAPRELERAS